MTIREKQSVFVRLLARLIDRANDGGYELTLAYAERSHHENERIGGHPQSLHLSRLAIDLNLFRDGEYLTSTEDWCTLGEWWEQQSTDEYTCAWGGRFSDGNHFSIEHGGVR